MKHPFNALLFKQKWENLESPTEWSHPATHFTQLNSRGCCILLVFARRKAYKPHMEWCNPIYTAENTVYLLGFFLNIQMVHTRPSNT